MNQAQKLWWKQALSDWSAYRILKKDGGADKCHQLHFLQMCSEKIAKAYLIRTLHPKRSHAGFGKFLRLLIQSTNSSTLLKVARVHQFKQIQAFESWIKSVRPLADDLEHLAPALANDGPNPEYPWPHDTPVHAPALFAFPILERLELAEGRSLLRFLEVSVTRFPEYADL